MGVGFRVRVYLICFGFMVRAGSRVSIPNKWIYGVWSIYSCANGFVISAHAGVWSIWDDEVYLEGLGFLFKI